MTKIEIENLMDNTNESNPIKKSFINKTQYYNDFLNIVFELSEILSHKQMQDIVKNKLQLGKQKLDLDEFYQYATELSVIYKFAKIPYDEFDYEKPVNDSKKNPECTIKCGDFILNVEAKCPKLEEIKTQSNRKTNLVMKSAGRAPDFSEYKEMFQKMKDDVEKNNSDVEMTLGKSKDNTLKSFLQSAHDKFADYRDDNELNMLFVALNDVHNIQEWYYYLCENGGLFTKEPFADPKTYSRVDVVVITNLLFRHKNNENINGNAWLVDDSFNLFLSSPCRQEAKEEANRFIVKFIKNYTNEIREHKIKWNIPEELKDFNFDWKIKIASFVKENLEKKQKIYFFEKCKDN